VKNLRHGLFVHPTSGVVNLQLHVLAIGQFDLRKYSPGVHFIYVLQLGPDDHRSDLISDRFGTVYDKIHNHLLKLA
jgi:hypothetical protein